MRVDLRSDTVTHPTEAMRQAMLTAEVGDDIYGEDPTVTELEAVCASLVGKEAALFVTSGTMGNQLGVLAQTRRGDEIIFEDECHIYRAEGSAFAFLGGLSAIPIKGKHGIMPLSDIQNVYQPGDDVHFTKTGLIALETTHNFSGGFALPLAYMQAVYTFAQSVNVPVHLDGARLFNAAVYLNCDVKDITQYCDSVTFCFSKGLCAPVGSIIAGSAGFIQRAKHIRKMLGGAMRQAGVLAAPALLSIRQMRDRLKDDWRRAVALADGLRDAGFQIDADIQSNIVMAYIPQTWKLDAAAVVAKLAGEDILCFDMGPNRVRFVTHYYITDDAVTYTIEKARALFAEL